MHRAPDWEARLAAYLDALRAASITFGYDHAIDPSHIDCCIFMADGVKAMTDVDGMAEFRNRYTTAIGAARALRRYGAGSLEATLDGKLRRLASPALAHRGDLVLAGGNGGISLGREDVLIGQCDAREGLISSPASARTAAWRVPYMDVALG